LIWLKCLGIGFLTAMVGIGLSVFFIAAVLSLRAGQIPIGFGMGRNSLPLIALFSIILFLLGFVITYYKLR